MLGRATRGPTVRSASCGALLTCLRSLLRGPAVGIGRSRIRSTQGATGGCSGSCGSQITPRTRFPAPRTGNAWETGMRRPMRAWPGLGSVPGWCRGACNAATARNALQAPPCPPPEPGGTRPASAWWSSARATSPAGAAMRWSMQPTRACWGAAAWMEVRCCRPSRDASSICTAPACLPVLTISQCCRPAACAARPGVHHHGGGVHAVLTPPPTWVLLARCSHPQGSRPQAEGGVRANHRGGARRALPHRRGADHKVGRRPHMPFLCASHCGPLLLGGSSSAVLLRCCSLTGAARSPVCLCAPQGRPLASQVRDPHGGPGVQE